MITGDSIVSVLLVDDDADDVELTKEAFRDSKLKVSLAVATDGVEALDYLRSEENVLPDLILLDLNMPRMNGQQVLVELKKDSRLVRIPVVILTTSEAEIDVIRAYTEHANCYISKPVDFNEFGKVVSSIQDFWFTVVKLPSADGS